MGIGINIKSILKIKKMTVTDLANETDIPVNTLYSMIKRDKNDEKFDTIMKIREALGVSLAELVGEENMGQYVRDIKKELGDYDWSVEMEDELYKLNSDGRKKAVELVELLTKIPEYSRRAVYDDICESERED
ncbi:helix-turn-helix domain-containing protein [Acetobacterium sp.]|uniref:helix-turn-helix domain-containing protein n=1 Tax=Acetobacterium sp. TaxID=1872094 RepID=UPI003593DA91